MPPPKKTSAQWVQCESCSSHIEQKLTTEHENYCPPSFNEITHPFVHQATLYGNVDIIKNEEIKSTTQTDRDNMVFLSQSVIQLCNLAIGDYCLVKLVNKNVDNRESIVARMVWPSSEKALTSVLFTQTGLSLTDFKLHQFVSVEKTPENITEASQIHVVLLNAPKSLEITTELRNRLHRAHIDRLVLIGNKLSIFYYGKILLFEIKNVQSTGDFIKKFHTLTLNDCNSVFSITEKTAWKLYKSETEHRTEKDSKNLLGNIGGLNNEISEIQHLMLCALGKKHVIKGFNIGKGVLLYGSSGTGKTMLANALAKWASVNVITIKSSELYAKYDNSIEENIKSLFDDAISHAPSIVILDEIDLLCPSRNTRTNDTEKKISFSIIQFLDELNEIGAKIFIIATTNKIDSIDLALRRCGRFDREIEIPVPNAKARLEILDRYLKNTETQIDSEALEEIANVTHGFVGADLYCLCSEAAICASKRDGNELNSEDFKVALQRVKPSAMREVQIEVPNVKWTDIGGQENLKLILRQAVEWPLKFAENFVRMGITPPKGVLMYGPPGCSKTMIAKALATESGLNFLSIKGPELFSKWVGESERAVREVFRKARQVAPSIIFFDEIDALGGERNAGSSASVQERVLAQLLTELDGVTPLGDVVVIAATNRPDRIDKALIRPGRLDRLVYVPLPDAETRRQIFELKLNKMPVDEVIKSNFLTEFVQETEGYSGAEVCALCHEAAMFALEDDINAASVKIKHFDKALQLVKPRTSTSLVQIYNNFIENIR